MFSEPTFLFIAGRRPQTCCHPLCGVYFEEMEAVKTGRTGNTHFLLPQFFEFTVLLFQLKPTFFFPKGAISTEDVVLIVQWREEFISDYEAWDVFGVLKDFILGVRAECVAFYQQGLVEFQECDADR